MRRLILLALAALTAVDLHAAVLQGWVFRDVNANGQRDATLADAAQDTYERGISGVAFTRRHVPFAAVGFFVAVNRCCLFKLLPTPPAQRGFDCRALKLD